MSRIQTYILVVLISFSFETIGGRTFYISSIGSDAGTGDKNSPYKTISKGAEMAQAGDTVYVLGGTYRERVSPLRGGVDGSPIVYFGEPNKNVIIKGSDMWNPSWTKLKTEVYYAVPNESMFNDDCYKDNKNPFKVLSSSTPYGRDGKAEVYFGFPGDTSIVFTIGQVFVDGVMFKQKPFLSEMKAAKNTWFYDSLTGSLYIHFQDNFPDNHTVEISTRRRIFAPHKRQLGYITVQGFVMEHCGNQYPANFWEATHPEWQQAGALGTRSGHHWVIKNNMIRFANGVGVDFGNEGNSGVDLETGTNGAAIGAGYHIIDSNYICDNGAGGTAAYFPRNITFTNNVIERNVNLLFTGSKRWESAGVKMHGPSNSVIAKNLFRNNYGRWTLWLDQGSGTNTRVHGNLIIGGLNGFDLEIGTATINKLIFDNNIIANNQYGIACRNSGGITALNNLILGATETAIYNSIDINSTGWSSDYHYYYNNVVLGCNSLFRAYPPDYYKSSDRRFDFNLYGVNAIDKTFNLITVDSLNFSDWKLYWKNRNSNVNYDFNSKLTPNVGYTLNTNLLLLELNINEDYLTAKSITYSVLDYDYNGDIIKNDGTSLPGPFQNLVQGINQISLWDGLKPLEEYIMPYNNLSTALSTVKFYNSDSLNVYSNKENKTIQIQYLGSENIFEIHVSVYNLFGVNLGEKVFNANGEKQFSGEINMPSGLGKMYIVKIKINSKSFSKKILLV